MQRLQSGHSSRPKEKKNPLFPYELLDLEQIIVALSLFLFVVIVKFVSALCLIDKMANLISLPTHVK